MRFPPTYPAHELAGVEYSAPMSGGRQLESVKVDDGEGCRDSEVAQETCQLLGRDHVLDAREREHRQHEGAGRCRECEVS